MLEKLKRHILLLVAALIGYSGYSRAQEEDAGLLDLEMPDPLPMVREDKVLQRTAGEDLEVSFDPFHLKERQSMQASSDTFDDYIPESSEQQSEEQGLPVVELESVMRLRGDGIAFFFGTPFREGETILVTDKGEAVAIRVINRHRVTVEYLAERYTLDLYERPRLMLGTKGAKLLGRDQQAEASTGEAEEGEDEQQPIG